MQISQINNYNTSFRSNEHREAAMQRLRELQKQEAERRKKKEADLLRRIESYYPRLDDKKITEVAEFFSNFTFSIQNRSEHKINEFFGDEEDAADSRKNLSPECQANSKMLREEVQKLEVVKDPVEALMVANRMQAFAPAEGIMSDEQQKRFVNGVKTIFSTIVRNADLNNFESEDRNSILDMVQSIEDSNSVCFGIEYRLKRLVDKLNNAKLKISSVPTVQVRHSIKKTATKVKK